MVFQLNSKSHLTQIEISTFNFLILAFKENWNSTKIGRSSIFCIKKLSYLFKSIYSPMRVTSIKFSTSIYLVNLHEHLQLSLDLTHMMYLLVIDHLLQFLTAEVDSLFWDKNLEGRNKYYVRSRSLKKNHFIEHAMPSKTLEWEDARIFRLIRLIPCIMIRSIENSNPTFLHVINYIFPTRQKSKAKAVNFRQRIVLKNIFDMVEPT